MTDNLKTFPEMVFFSSKSLVGDTPFDFENRQDASDIGYVRADEAKEREDKLINATKLLCDTTLNLREPRFPATEEIYAKAGLEKFDE